jgi:glycosyltransferase involved in cell wall biosynthesis
MSAQVLVFAPSLGMGGADRVLLTLLEHFDRAKLQPTLALVHRDGPWLAEVPRDVRVIDLEARRLATSVVALVRVLRSEQPDIVFSLQGGTNVIAALAHVVARSRARLVLSERSPLVRPDRSRGRLAIELPLKRAAYRRADVITSLSNGVARELHERLGVPRAKLRVIYNPTVDTRIGELAAESVEHPWFHDGVPIIVAVGRLVEIKDYPTLLAAFARVRAARRVRLVVLGDGPLRRTLDNLVASLGIGDDVAFLGFDKNPFKYVARARVMAHTSRAEGLGSAIVQALACGTPVVATDCDFGPRELIESGQNGFLVPVGDSAAVADRILEIVGDDALRDRMSRRAVALADDFTVATSVARFEAALCGD